MRLAMLSWESLHGVAVGGISAHVTELAHALAGQDHEVHLFTRGRGGQPEYEPVAGIHVHRCPFALDSDFSREIHNLGDSFAEHVWATETVAGRFDLVHGHDWLTVPALNRLKNERGGRPVVVTFHSTEYGRCGNNFWGGPSEGVRHLEWLGGYVANRVIAVSETLRREILGIYGVPPDKARTIYNGVNPERFSGFINPGAVKRLHGIGPLDPTVLFAGRLVYQKGPDLLVDAIPAVRERQPRARFIFAGDGDMRPGLEDACRYRGIADSVRFLGKVEGQALVNLFKSADVVCVPSRNEPFGIVILEAWSAGKPVVVSHSGGPAEFVWAQVNGLVVGPSGDGLAWGLNEMFADFGRARWMGRNGRVAVETAFSWRVIARQTAEVYESALA